MWRGPGVRRGDQAGGSREEVRHSRERPSRTLRQMLELNLRDPDRLSKILKKYTRKSTSTAVLVSGKIILEASI